MNTKCLSLSDISKNEEIKNFLYECIARTPLNNHTDQNNVLLFMRNIGWTHETIEGEKYLLFSIPRPGDINISDYQKARNKNSHNAAYNAIYKLIYNSQYSGLLIGCLNYSDIHLTGTHYFDNKNIVSYYRENESKGIVELKNCIIYPGDNQNRFNFNCDAQQIKMIDCKLHDRTIFKGSKQYEVIDSNIEVSISFDNTFSIKNSSVEDLSAYSDVGQISLYKTQIKNFYINSKIFVACNMQECKITLMSISSSSDGFELSATSTNFTSIIAPTQDENKNCNLYLDGCEIGETSNLSALKSIKVISLEKCLFSGNFYLSKINIESMNISNCAFSSPLLLNETKFDFPPVFHNNKIVVHDAPASILNNKLDQILYGIKSIEEYYSGHKEIEKYSELKAFSFDAMHLYKNRYGTYDHVINRLFKFFSNYGLSFKRPLIAAGIFAIIHLLIYSIILIISGYRMDFSINGAKTIFKYVNNLFNASPFTIVFDRVDISNNAGTEVILSVVDGFTGIGISISLFFILLTLRRRYQIT